MLGMVKLKEPLITGRTVYMEIYGVNRVAYRVTVGIAELYGEKITTYGIEAENCNTGEKEFISNFSADIEDAVDFAEILISYRTKPKNIYSMALSYLGSSI